MSDRYELPLDPNQVRLPLPPPPSDPDLVARWMELYRAHMELARFSTELVKLGAEQARASADRLKAEKEMGALEREQQKAVLELRMTELAAAEAERKDLERRAEPSAALVYTFYRGVNEDTVRDAIATLDEWSRRRPGGPVVVQLTSPGGSVLDGLAFYDFLQTLRDRGHHVTTHALGVAASMGSVLLQAGDERVIGANSFVLIHEVSTGAYGSLSALEDRVDMTRMLQQRLINILCGRSNLTPQQVKRMWRKKDVLLDADAALSLGLVDRLA